jgi:TatD DNase family protein
MLIDSHSHFDDRSFDPDRDAAWQRACAAGVEAQIIPAVTAVDWPRVKEICGRYPGLYPAYGLHPMFCDVHREQDLETLQQWLETESPVAVGECGLDFYIENPDKEKQQRIFEAQLELAQEHRLPVIIHARRAVEEVIQALRRYPGVRGVLHSYSGSEEQAMRLIELGFKMSFGGPVTFPRATRLRKLVSRLPLEAILLETDSPDQPDSSHRNQRNEPAYLPLILQEISALREEPPELVAATTTRNTKALFGITP